ncbi:MAG: hypothetical protein P4L76_13890 [Beijerinckiaceae bacterium]|nr:hypothetical protein [Beijerinckiaceae bacterium]
MTKVIHIPNDIQSSWSGIPSSEAYGLAMSQDGKKIAVYTHYGKNIEIFNIDGSLNEKITVSCLSLSVCAHSLAFITPDEIVLGAVGIGNWDNLSEQEKNKINHAAFVIYDLSQKKITRYIQGPSPDGNFVSNAAQSIVISDDGRFLATTHLTPNEGRFQIYSTKDWSPLISIKSTDVKGLTLSRLYFSKNNEYFGVAAGGRLKIYRTSDWSEKVSILPFKPIKYPQMSFASPVMINDFSFSDDGKSVAIDATDGNIIRIFSLDDLSMKSEIDNISLGFTGGILWNG